MDTKLTLKLDQGVIERAKKYASKQNISLSKLIEIYLQAVTTDSNRDDIQISPFIKSLSTGTKIPHDLDYKKEYHDHVAKKYS
ncbi:DUF6364 family protein [Parapedobacter sp. DT-150]|uniref:DUF6364 family protein n=1 Tax=Parapedobacter sp. DT-150 TaxID=3396162 RepID=UPI003F1DEE61